MNKKGFTLTELLVVIAIIGILSVIIVPSVITINNNINERLLAQKIEQIISAAELYGSNNEEIFNGTTEVEVYVYELIESNYLGIDTKVNNDNCNNSSKGQTNKGCMIDPVEKSSMNNLKVILRKGTLGITGEFEGSGSGSSGSDSENGSKKVVETICKGFNDGTFVGQTMDANGNIVTCQCNATNTALLANGVEVDACLISGDNVNNFLKYGSSVANWRVMGLYKLDPDSNLLYPKIITSEPI